MPINAIFMVLLLKRETGAAGGAPRAFALRRPEFGNPYYSVKSEQKTQ
jgi:hypothetical protein